MLTLCNNAVTYSYRDNPDVDVMGANLYDRYLQRVWSNPADSDDDDDIHKDHMPECRAIPKSPTLYKQTVRSMESVLVGTGVFKPGTNLGSKGPNVYHGHRDIENEPELTKPSRFSDDVYHGIEYILKRENFNPCTIAS